MTSNRLAGQRFASRVDGWYFAVMAGVLAASADAAVPAARAGQWWGVRASRGPVRADDLEPVEHVLRRERRHAVGPLSAAPEIDTDLVDHNAARMS